MSTWYNKNIGNGVSALGPSLKIREAFSALVSVSGQVSDVAVFSRYDTGAKLVTVYFTPSASVLASAFGAAPCAKPEPAEGFSLLVGDDRSWEVHFPGYGESLH